METILNKFKGNTKELDAVENGLAKQNVIE
jgi:hypothetical protein